jgi:hypothetical protein
MNEQEILRLIEEDEWMMNILHEAERLNLPQWIIGAGFVRNKVWDYLHDCKRGGVETNDIDLVYYDPNGNDEKADEALSLSVTEKTGKRWEILNAKYTHSWEQLPPYVSAEDAIAHWPETATAVGICLEEGKLRLIAPYGIDDLVSLNIRVSPKFRDGMHAVRLRVDKKRWMEKWPKLNCIGFNHE